MLSFHAVVSYRLHVLHGFDHSLPLAVGQAIGDLGVFSRAENDVRRVIERTGDAKTANPSRSTGQLADMTDQTLDSLGYLGFDFATVGPMQGLCHMYVGDK